MHSIALLLLAAIAVPVLVFAAAFLMSHAADWAWSSSRRRALVMLATGVLYLALGGGLLLTGEPWLRWAFFALAGLASAGIGGLRLLTLARPGRSASA